MGEKWEEIGRIIPRHELASSVEGCKDQVRHSSITCLAKIVRTSDENWNFTMKPPRHISLN
jgi:hypothetical protein